MSICDTLFDPWKSSKLTRSLGTMVITTEKLTKAVSKLFLPRNSSLRNKIFHPFIQWLFHSFIHSFIYSLIHPKATIFCCFDVCSIRPPQIFQVQAKVSTLRSMFLDYLSVSYDYAFSKSFHSDLNDSKNILMANF